MPVVIGLSIAAWLICGYFSFRLFRYRWRNLRCWTARFTAITFLARLLFGPIGLIPELMSWWRPTDFEIRQRMHDEAARRSWNGGLESHAVTEGTWTCGYCGGSGDCYCKRRQQGASGQCPRCRGTGKCYVCQGVGVRT